MSSFAKLASLTVSTKRSPAISGGRRGAPTTYLEDVPCTPLDPVDPDLRARLALNTPHELLQTFASGGYDILEGDILVSGGVDYPIRSAAQWTDFRGVTFVHLVIEDLKT